MTTLNEEKSYYMKDYRRKNKERIQQQRKEYREKNKEKISQQQKEWRRKNEERLRRYRKEYYQKYREKECEYQKEYRKENIEKIREQRKTYREMNKERILAKEREKYRKTRLEVLMHYSKGQMKCACCSCKDVWALEIDHINTDGAEDRKKHGVGRRFYSWLIRNDFPDSFQILCANCNRGKQVNAGICPHKLEGR